MTRARLADGLVLSLVAVAVPTVVAAQDEGGGAPPGGGSAPNVTVEVVPGGPPQTSSQSSIFGPAPESVGSINKYLPSSSQASTDVSSSSDGFDLRRGGGDATVVRGGNNGAYILEGQYVPDTHTAKRGDTLWDISSKYYGNPYNWPRIWAMNKQLQNPHWIYPGDQLRLRGGNGVRMVGGFVRPEPLVSPNTVFQRFPGYVLDGDATPPRWGELIGAPDDQMLLAENDLIYVKLDEEDDDGNEIRVEVGQQLTIFEPREVKNLADGPLVWIRGVAEVDRVNPKTRMVRARITESLTVIERGALVGPMDRKVDVVQPTRNDTTVKATIVGALYPFELYGQGQVVFIDKGTEDSVEVGNRFFAVSRGDRWRLGLDRAGSMADDRAITEDDRFARVEDTPDTDEPELYPVETYAELIVLRAREHTATCLITASVREIPRGATVVAREGY